MTEPKKRIKNELIDINNEKVKSFFAHREKRMLPHRYNYVNYQDDNPSLAIERDRIEKEKVKAFFPIDSMGRYLDVGCGVGRWGDYIVPLLTTGKYVGVDYTRFFVDIAKKQFKDNSNVHFIQGSFQNLRNVLTDANESERYSGILVNGVLMYINDDDVNSCLALCDEYLNKGGFLYIKESVGINGRLTLKDYYSDELGADYNVIYRSIKEYTYYINQFFLSNSYALIACMPSWEKGIDFSSETSNYIWIMKKY